MKIHYYGKLDSMESCYTYQAFDIDGTTLLLQNAPRFGYEPASMTIKNPALFIKQSGSYYRFVIEDLEVEVKDGILSIGETKVREIFNAARILL